MTLRQPNLLDKLGSLIPGYRGYADRDVRRTADQRLRQAVAGVLDDAKSSLYPLIDQLVGAGNLDAISRVQGLQKRLGLCADAIRYAQQGGSGYFDATVVKADDLTRACQHDAGVHEQATALAASVKTLSAASLDQALPSLVGKADELLATIRQRDAIFQEVFQCPS